MQKKIPQYVHFRCGRVHIKKVSKKIGECFKLQRSLLKEKMDHDGIHENAWEDIRNEWLPHLKNDVLSAAFCYARYTKVIEELT